MGYPSSRVQRARGPYVPHAHKGAETIARRGAVSGASATPGARLIVSYGLCAADNQPKRCELEWPALIDWLRTEFYDKRGPGPKDGPYLSFADYGTKAAPHPKTGELVTGLRAY